MATVNDWNMVGGVVFSALEDDFYQCVIPNLCVPFLDGDGLSGDFSYLWC